MPDDEDDDPIADLRDRIRATQEAAERFASEASYARSSYERGEVPPSGWATTEEHRERADEVQALAAIFRTLRDLIPPDLEEQFREVLRQLLLLVRALIDWWLERVDAQGGDRGGAPPRDTAIEDIPID